MFLHDCYISNPKNVLGLLPDLAGAWQETLLPLLILSLLRFHDMTFSWFSLTSSQSPLSVHPYLVVITYQNSWRLVLGLLTLLFRVGRKRTGGRQQGDQNRRVREIDLYTKRWMGKLRLGKAKHTTNKSNLEDWWQKHKSICPSTNRQTDTRNLMGYI